MNALINKKIHIAIMIKKNAIVIAIFPYAKLNKIMKRNEKVSQHNIKTSSYIIVFGFMIFSSIITSI